MKILLINNNPVVSRLTALSARKENVSIDEIKNISELKADNYNIIFVDGESFNNDVSNIIRNSGVEKRVLFYSQGEEDNHSIFTQTILKPFLPSEVSEILRETKVSLLKEKENSKEKSLKETLDFDDLVDTKAQKELELPIIEEKKEKHSNISNNEPPLALDLEPTGDTKEIKNRVNEKKDEFDEKLEEAFPINLDTLSDSKLEEVSFKKEESKESQKDMFDLNDDLFELDDKKETQKNNLIDNELFELDKEIKDDVLSEAPLEFEEESKKEIDFEDKGEKKIEKKEIDINTQVLDQTEISNIKDILDEKEGADKLTQIPTSLMSLNNKEEESRKEENLGLVEKTVVENTVVEKNTQKENIQTAPVVNNQEDTDALTTGVAIANTLSKLPVEDLRKLLRGAKVNVSIEFSNEL